MYGWRVCLGRLVAAIGITMECERVNQGSFRKAFETLGIAPKATGLGGALFRSLAERAGTSTGAARRKLA